ncbi:MAG: hypothetical protein WCQ77_07770 [Planctomycetota bacterium]
MQLSSTTAVLLLAAITFLTALGTGAQAEPPVSNGETISLEDQLKTGLKARRAEEREFIDEVARRVNQGALPRKLVDSTFIWAVSRRQSYPFPAFERALRMQAEKLGVGL